MHLRTRLLLATAIATTHFQSVWAVDRTWLNAGGGLFETTTNWSGNLAPVAADNAIFNLNDSGYTVTLGAPRQNTNLFVDKDNVTFALGGFTYTLTGQAIVGNFVNDVATVSLNNGTLAGSSLTVANLAATNATLTLSGTMVGTFSSTLRIGNFGVGTMQLTSGADLTTGAATFGDNANGSGVMLVSGSGSTWTTTGNVLLGSGGTGGLNITAGGSVSFQDLLMGSGTIDSIGTVSLSGATSRLNLTGQASIGSTGIATLTIDAGTFGSAVGFIGGGGLGRGTAVIRNGATWTNTGSLNVGNAGMGTVILDHGSLSATTGNLGVASTGIGFVDLSGLGGPSTMSLTSLLAGNAGVATLLVRGGSDVVLTNSTAGDLDIGVAGGSRGFVNVDGVDSSITGGGTLRVGVNGSGTMILSNGGTCAFPDDIRIADNASASGTLILSGAATSISTIHDVFVGGDDAAAGGFGLITINPGATALAGGIVRLWPAGQVDLNGGTFTAQTITLSGGTINWNSGTLNITGGAGASVGAPLLGSVLDLTPGKSLVLISNLQVLPGALLVMNGGNLFLGNTLNISNGGEVVLGSDVSQVVASIQVQNAGLIRGNGRISGFLVNSSTGEVRAEDGKRIKFINTSPAASNTGKLNLLGGILEFASPVTNNAAGKINGRGTVITAGLTNNGTISLSGGLTDVFGSVTNANGSRVFVTGGATATFYDPMTMNAGSNFQVSTDSTAVFLAAVTGTSNFSGPGTKDFEAGGSPGPIASLVGDTYVGPLANVTATHIREDDLTIEGVAAIAANGTSAATSRVNTLNIIDGRLDLNDNDLVIDYTGTSPISTIKGYLTASYASGAWNGDTGIGSSAARTIANDDANPHKTALGFAEASSLGLSSFSGQSVDSSAIVIRYVFVGDANLDGVVNALDFNAVASNFGAASGKFWVQGDFNYDGMTNTSDFTLLGSNFNQVLPTPPVLASLIPEPSMLLPALAAAMKRSRLSRRGR